MIELLVVVSIIALLVAILLPAMAKARKQSRSAVCLSNLHQWGLAVGLYMADNEGNLFSYTFYRDWPENPAHFEAMQDGFYHGALRKYHDYNDDIRLCPEADEPDLNDNNGCPEWGSTFTAWGHPNSGDPTYRGDIGSYCWNVWAHHFDALTYQCLLEWAPSSLLDRTRFWNSDMNAEAPLLADGLMPDTWPSQYDLPASYDDQPICEIVNQSRMARVALNRHYGAINVLFGDGSASRVPLPQLWNIRWHKKFETFVFPMWWGN